MAERRDSRYGSTLVTSEISRVPERAAGTTWLQSRVKVGVVAVSVTLACWVLLGLPQRYPVWEGGGWARVTPIPARRVVVQPWFGPHHVYGVFFVPEEYDGRDYVVTVAHDGDTRVIESGVLDLSSGESGEFVRAYASTRFALWTMLEGSGRQLRRADDWILLVKTDDVE